MINRRKLVVVGDYSGKTTTVKTFTRDEVPKTYIGTVDLEITDIEVNGQIIEVQIWDTCSRTRFESPRKSIFRGADAILLFFTIYSRTSFENVKEIYLPEILQSERKNAPLLLVGTRCNEPIRKREPAVGVEEAQRLVEEINAIGYIECSAVCKLNVEEVFARAVAATM